jgi:hypothetical protein
MQGNTMNKRILELAKEAGMRSPDLFKLTVSHMSTDTLEKFAELIVRECTKVCNDVGVAIFAEPVQNNFGTAQTCKLAIEKHFGVEE